MQGRVMTPPKVRHLTPEELAERLGGDFSVATLKRWRRTGYGPKPIKVGRHVRYRLAEVEAWERALLAATA